MCAVDKETLQQQAGKTGKYDKKVTTLDEKFDKKVTDMQTDVSTKNDTLSDQFHAVSIKIEAYT